MLKYVIFKIALICQKKFVTTIKSRYYLAKQQLCKPSHLGKIISKNTLSLYSCEVFEVLSKKKKKERKQKPEEPHSPKAQMRGSVNGWPKPQVSVEGLSQLLAQWSFRQHWINRLESFVTHGWERQVFSPFFFLLSWPHSYCSFKG